MNWKDHEKAGLAMFPGAIDTGITMPEPAHVQRNRDAAAAFDVAQPRIRPDASQRFNEAKYRAERGGYRRYPPGHSRRGERAVASEPMPLFSKRVGHCDWLPKGRKDRRRSINAGAHLIWRGE